VCCNCTNIGLYSIKHNGFSTFEYGLVSYEQLPQHLNVMLCTLQWLFHVLYGTMLMEMPLLCLVERTFCILNLDIVRGYLGQPAIIPMQHVHPTALFFFFFFELLPWSTIPSNVIPHMSYVQYRQKTTSQNQSV
jgi:hypothetical protein